MAISAYVYEGAILTAAATVQGEAVGALAKRIIRSATLTNTTAAAVAASVYFVPTGKVVGADNIRISARPIAPGESYPCPELLGKGMNPGTVVQAVGAGLTFDFTATDII